MVHCRSRDTASSRLEDLQGDFVHCPAQVSSEAPGAESGEVEQRCLLGPHPRQLEESLLREHPEYQAGDRHATGAGVQQARGHCGEALLPGSVE